ncbi:glycosyltransferase [Terrimicrobium sacchariphilum]|uniref:Glycosyltransferase n=1 Tax=Terrimicrobium sacchariphilum TaxID=690879 RepID=A0A146G294_TERSA|nr:glycosyltransferase family 4 protein [Terrimicrobium sacchariphilum]GAT31760.1 glycosyltransferase [Terrimicrobium sacchariphilum]
MRIALLTVDNREFGQKSETPQFGSAVAALLEGFDSLPEVNVDVLSCVRNRSFRTCMIGSRIQYHPIYVSSQGWLRSAYLGCSLKVRRALKALEPDIIHAQGTERWCAVAGAFPARAPRVLTIHGNIRLINKITPLMPRSYWRVQELLERICISRFDAVTCLSHYTKRHLSARSGELPVIPNAVESRFFSINPAPTSPLRILFIANIQERKNQVAWINAIKPLFARFPFEVHFFGVAPQDDAYVQSFHECLHSHSNLIYRGAATRDTIESELTKAAIVVLPSLEENCPMAVLEASAAGIPVITSDCSGSKELIQDRENGLLCNPKDAGSMRQALSTLLEDPQLRAKLARNSRHHAEKTHAPRIVAKQHLDLYENLTAKRSGTHR